MLQFLHHLHELLPPLRRVLAKLVLLANVLSEILVLLAQYFISHFLRLKAILLSHDRFQHFLRVVVVQDVRFDRLVASVLEDLLSLLAKLLYQSIILLGFFFVNYLDGLSLFSCLNETMVSILALLMELLE